jgi:hypothetical protein
LLADSTQTTPLPIIQRAMRMLKLLFPDERETIPRRKNVNSIFAFRL